MFLSRQSVTLSGELSQCSTDAETCIARFDDVVNISVFSSLIRISEELVVLVFLLSDEGLHILASFLLSLCFLSIKNCPYETDSHRSDIKQIFAQLEQMNPEARYSLWNSMNNIQTELLPQAKNN